MMDAPAPPSSGTGDLAWETVTLLKRQHARQSRTWAELLEAKEAALRAGRDRQAALERELSAALKKVEAADQRIFAEVMDAQGRATQALKALETEKAAAEQERRRLEALLDEARRAGAAEAARARAEAERWQKREQQYLLDLAELQALAARRGEEREAAEGDSRRSADGLREAKNALEKTLAELLHERKVREETEAERAKALKKFEDSQKHLEELSRIWEEERSQWRELWDRERSTWESQRQEFSAWEQNLRKEREAWQAQLSAQERDQARYAEDVTRTLRDSSQTSEQLAGVMRRLASVETVGRPAFAWGDWARRAGALAGAVALAAGLWTGLGAWTLRLVDARPLAAAAPTGMALAGSTVWFSAWDGRLTAFELADLKAPLRVAAVGAAAPYHPTGLAAGPSSLWSIDTAQARIVRHDLADPSRVVWTRSAPGPAPTALAFDGKRLWSYDAVNRALYQHGEDEGSFKAYGVDDGIVPTAMQWVSGRLWVFDAKAGLMRVCEVQGDRIKPLWSRPLSGGAIALAAAPEDDGSVLILVGPASGRDAPMLQRFKYGPRLFTIF